MTTTTTTWIVIDPVDTLFFRGAESMVAGENHEVDTLFPPMPQTIIGAIRTAVLTQRGISPKAYFADPGQEPFLGPPERAGFALIGPLFLANDETLLLPAPAHWFSRLPVGPSKELKIQPARPLRDTPLGLKGSIPNPFWVVRPQDDDLKPLAGWWTTPATLQAVAAGRTTIPVATDATGLQADTPALLPQSGLFTREERLGIALTGRRTARDGHLYTTAHIRLRPGIALLAGITSPHEPPLAPNGILQLGGEQRLCRYTLRREFDFATSADSGLLMTLSPLPLADLPEDLRHCPRAAGKLYRIGGWDMRTRFHKPMDTWLPPGAVFAPPSVEHVPHNFVAI